MDLSTQPFPTHTEPERVDIAIFTLMNAMTVTIVSVKKNNNRNIVNTNRNNKQNLQNNQHKLPVIGGSQLAIDMTLRSCLTREGLPRPRSDWQNGVTAESARGDKERKYPELASGTRCRLVVLAIEVGGRFSDDTIYFIRQLVATRVGTVPRCLRAATAAPLEPNIGNQRHLIAREIFGRGQGLARQHGRASRA